jgi:hypothetical protein
VKPALNLRMLYGIVSYMDQVNDYSFTTGEGSGSSNKSTSAYQC